MNESKETNMNMEAAIIFESYLPDALRQALDYAGDNGFVASMPALLRARTNAAYDNIIWNTWFAAHSEESVVRTAQGNHVVVAVHGGGIYATPERFERTYHADMNRSNTEGFTGQYAGKISEREAADLLKGKLPDGTEIPVYAFGEFRQGVTDLPRRYAVVMDFESVRKSKSGYQTFDELKEEPLMIVRAGGIEAAAAYLDKARDRHNTMVMGNWHPFNRINPDQPQTRILFLSGNKGGVGSEDNDDHINGYDADSGIAGGDWIHNTSMINVARYVAVAPRDASTSVRDLPFNAS
jgi:hypothetical protein